MPGRPNRYDKPARSPFRRLPAGLALGRVSNIPGATFLLSATALIVFVFVLACADEAPAFSEPGIYVALVQPAPGADFSRGWTAPLRVLEVTTGGEQSFGPPALYFDVAWAPDGSKLAALAFVGDTSDELHVQLRTWTREGDLLHEVKIPLSRFTETIAWSPDSSRIALLGQGIMMLDSNATELGWFSAPQRACGGASSQSPPAHPWSSDSAWVAIQGNGLLLLADREGPVPAMSFPQIPRPPTEGGSMGGCISLTSAGRPSSSGLEFLRVEC